MLEAGAVFAALIAALRVIEKLVDQKFGKRNGPVQIDINQTEVATTLKGVAETQQSIASTLEKAGDRLDSIDTRTRETGATIYEVRELLRIEQTPNTQAESGCDVWATTHQTYKRYLLRTCLGHR